MILTNAFYWDRDDETRAFAKKFEQRVGRPPHMGDAGDYSSTLHYLKAVQAAGTVDTEQGRDSLCPVYSSRLLRVLSF